VRILAMISMQQALECAPVIIKCKNDNKYMFLDMNTCEIGFDTMENLDKNDYASYIFYLVFGDQNKIDIIVTLKTSKIRFLWDRPQYLKVSYDRDHFIVINRDIGAGEFTLGNTETLILANGTAIQWRDGFFCEAVEGSQKISEALFRFKCVGSEDIE
jgi:hypothetical protein